MIVHAKDFLMLRNIIGAISTQHMNARIIAKRKVEVQLEASLIKREVMLNQDAT